MPAAKNELIVQPFDGRDGLIKMIDSALFEINGELYFLGDRPLIGAMKKAQARGVKVDLLLESTSRNNSSESIRTLTELAKSSMNVDWGNPEFELTHEKALVIDDRMAVIMTFDPIGAAFSRNRGFAVITNDTADVSEITRVCEADEMHANTICVSPRLVWSPVNARDRILAFIDRSKRTLDVYTQQLYDKDVEEHLISAAARGVTVRMIMPPDQKDKGYLTPSQENVAEGGVHLKIYNTPFIHARAMISDGEKAFVGSQNLSSASLDRNRELGIILDEPALITRLSQTFEKDWNSKKASI